MGPPQWAQSRFAAVDAAPFLPLWFLLVPRGGARTRLPVFWNTMERHPVSPFIYFFIYLEHCPVQMCPEKVLMLVDLNDG